MQLTWESELIVCLSEWMQNFAKSIDYSKSFTLRYTSDKIQVQKICKNPQITSPSSGEMHKIF